MALHRAAQWVTRAGVLPGFRPVGLAA